MESLHCTACILQRMSPSLAAAATIVESWRWMGGVGDGLNQQRDAAARLCWPNVTATLPALEGAHGEGSGPGITTQEFQDAVYTFDIGQNDLQLALAAGLSYDRILVETIPAIVTRIKNAVTMVHEAGGRKFLLYNTGALGCLPSMLARRGGGSELDRAGCLVDHNGVAGEFNAQLGRLCRDLRAKLANATVVCVDMYAIKYGLVANHTAHGFSEPLMACCGSGGPPYNYRAGKACAVGDRRISWDGIHYTEDANRVVADKVLSAEYSDPPLRFPSLCTSQT
ncbi:GDSL esterase/lipase LIP-4-like [Panicum miliaceum]|uniref:GDSL esterase/lipase LIP-4-like n=1 Tax=Panicum miliaceum TaxID=4540 RepID=A0A3L6TB79_PANMI|nr:GDSL esterase/lipase LIP-4-like [Panicum miliaceum]